MPRIWFMGEALIDFVPTGSAIGPAYAPRAGGSPFNAAKAAARAGADAGFLGAISTDLFGDLLMADLADCGVETGHTPRVADPTTLAFVDLATGMPRYAFFNAQTAVARMAPDPAAFLPGPGDVVSFGSISLIDQPGADNIARFALAMAGRALITLDPNARPGMTPDPAAWRTRIGAIVDVAGIVKLSDEDLEFLSPGTAPADFARAQLARGAGLVVVTLGTGGALAFSQTAEVALPAIVATGGDTVGAGDTLMGALLAELVRAGLTVPAALAGLGEAALAGMLRFAIAAAALNCREVGCVPPRRAAVDAFLARQGRAA